MPSGAAKERTGFDMLALRLHMEFSPETHDEAVSVLRSLVGPVRAESGCNATRFLHDAGSGCGLTWVEEWHSVEDFERHLRSPVFRRILAIIELAESPPVVEIDEVASRRGFELVEEILGVAPEAGVESEAG
jgi:quinol monooxygenase YgiN